MTSQDPGQPIRSDDPTSARPVGDLEDAYLRRAIGELSALQDELSTISEEEGSELPVHPSGSPRAEIMLVKWGAGLAERQEGVAFFGRAGDAVLKSVQRLGIDPLLLYGTLCAKLPDWDVHRAAPWLARELAIVRPALVVVMGEPAQRTVAATEMPLSEPIADRPGVVQRWTPTIDAIVVPDIDQALDEQGAKRAFWAAFRAVGEWYAAQPPY